MNKQNLFKNTGINEAIFLKEYWHKKPLLLKNAFALADLNILPNKQKLMQMSCEEDIQSRVVFKESETQYDVELGPFEEQDLANFEDYCWNLLVSDVDKWQPKSREILKYFGFIRNWILDDIMISTGSTGGTVGPHTDHYDVFLIQVHGQRNWKYTQDKIYNPKLMKEQDLKLMQGFKEDESFILNPGDVLYLPPEVAHYGIATSDDCVTCSVGIRTPSHSELLTSFVDSIAQNISADERFNEPEFSKQPNSGEITTDDLSNISKILTNNLNQNNMSEWFGKFITEYRSIFYEFNQQQDITELDKPIDLIPSPFSKTCYFQQEGIVNLFVNGESFKSSLQLAILICNDKFISSKHYSLLKYYDIKILESLYTNGSIIKVNSEA